MNSRQLPNGYRLVLHDRQNEEPSQSTVAAICISHEFTGHVLDSVALVGHDREGAFSLQEASGGSQVIHPSLSVTPGMAGSAPHPISPHLPGFILTVAFYFLELIMGPSQGQTGRDKITGQGASALQ